MKTYVVAALLGLAAFSGGVAQAGPLPVLDRQAPAVGSQQPLILVQGVDPTIQVQQLQEEIRQLNGRIEEMSFQLLQMQETIRKAQEDNEFRFQELERGKGKKSGALEQPAATPPADDVAAVIEQPAEAGALPDDTQDLAATDPATAPAGTAQAPAASNTLGAPQATLGSIELDANGNPVRATINPDTNNGSGALPGVDTGAAPATPTETASLGSESDSYQVAYGHVLSGDYALAETEFQSFIATYPASSKLADANFWLGEAYYSQGKYNESAKTFLNAHQNFAKSQKAPEMLLKLGMSLAALDNKDTACATMREVSKRYPKASRAVINKVASEVKRLGC